MKTSTWSVLALLTGSVGCGMPDGEATSPMELGDTRTGIARGTDVPDGTYPWAVSLHSAAAAATTNRICSGAHIAPGWVLTAQHCFDDNLDGTISAAEFSATEIWASLNRTRISETNRGQVLQGAQVFLNNTNDLALLRLASASNAPTVQLATAIPAVNAAVTPAGWGRIENNTIPDNMQEGEFRVTGSNALDLTYINVNTEEMCPGDSGGPVFTQVNGLFQLVAVHTNSPPGCGVSTGNATGSRVDVALPWIRGIIPAAFGFVWADQPATASYSPSASYSFNSSGGLNTITRLGTGSYRIDMPGLGQPGGNVQVTAYGSANRCKSAGWSAFGTSQSVSVQCFTPAGAAADTQFVAQYYRAGVGNPGQGAYLWADQPTSASYTPAPQYSYNSRGGTNQVSRTGVGVYSATLPGFTSAGGNVQVTAYGSTSEYCKVFNWGINTVNIRCFDTAGNPTDTRWSLRYTDQHVANNGQLGAYAWISDATAAAHTPPSTYQWHTLGNTLTATHPSTGVYVVTIPNMPGSNRTSATVTAYGSSSAYCNIDSWLGDAFGATQATVTCRNPAGTLTGSPFTLSYITNL